MVYLPGKIFPLSALAQMRRSAAFLPCEVVLATAHTGNWPWGQAVLVGSWLLPALGATLGGSRLFSSTLQHRILKDARYPFGVMLKIFGGINGSRMLNSY